MAGDEARSPKDEQAPALDRLTKGLIERIKGRRILRLTTTDEVSRQLGYEIAPRVMKPCAIFHAYSCILGGPETSRSHFRSGIDACMRMGGCEAA